MARFTAMVDMAKTPDVVKKEVAQMVPMPSPAADAKPSVPVYPYGLCICLEDDELEKLGFDEELPAVGDMIHFIAMARVTSASQSEREMSDGSKTQCRRIELQITHLSTEDEDTEGVAAAKESMAADENRRKRFYNGDGMPKDAAA